MKDGDEAIVTSPPEALRVKQETVAWTKVAVRGTVKMDQQGVGDRGHTEDREGGNCGDKGISPDLSGFVTGKSKVANFIARHTLMFL